MSNPVIPRSRSQILGTMIDTLLSKLGLPSLPVGDPTLDILETAAQSDLRSTQDVFNALNAKFLDNASGIQLDSIGNAENVQRLASTAATEFVTIGDSSFTPIVAKLYQGANGVSAGSTEIQIDTEIPANGSLYLGRGTASVEGPIAYTTVTPVGTHFAVSLSSATQNYHQAGELVTYAQGGNRVISAGEVVSTSVLAGGAVKTFKTQFDAVIPDGENVILGVYVVATEAGSASNVPVGAINTFQSPPFPTATVTNPNRVTNGRDVEKDNDYRERIRLHRKSLSKATQSAIVDSLINVSSPEESGRILSVSTLYRQGEPRTVYIDDGTGYQEKEAGVAYEVLTIAANGGEVDFALSNRPVAKANLKTIALAPFYAVPYSKISFKVGGVESTHQFQPADFRNPISATAYEVADSINANRLLLFNAKVCEGGKKVAIFAKAEGNEDLELIDSTAQNWLNFARSHAFTLNLYKNGQLLFEDGIEASVISNPISQWGTVSSGLTVTATVDGVSIPTITITDTDFVNAGTGYVTVSSANSLESWKKVLNFKIPGISASVIENKIKIQSNRGRSDDANISLSGTLIAAMFGGPVSANGRTSDYSLDRSTGHIALNSPLNPGDSLIAGSERPDNFLQSTIGTSLDLLSDALLWVVEDQEHSYPALDINAGTTLTWATDATPTWGRRVSITLSGASTTQFQNVQEGDWLIIEDDAISADNKGLFRINKVVSNTKIVIDRATGSYSSGAVTGFKPDTISIVRCPLEPKLVTVPAGLNYTPSSLAVIFSNSISGLNAYAYADKLRISSFNPQGKISVAARNDAAAVFQFPTKTIKDADTQPYAVALSGSDFNRVSDAIYSITGVTNQTTYTPSTLGGVSSALISSLLRPLPDSANQDRASNWGSRRTIESFSGTDLTVREPANKEWLVGDVSTANAGFTISPYDQINVMLDNNEETGRYSIDLFKSVKVVAESLGSFEVSELNDTSLANSFGLDFDWNDFEVSMRPMVKTYSFPDSDKTVLYRWRKFASNPFGQSNSFINYDYARTSNQPVALGENNGPFDLSVLLASGGARSTGDIRPSTKIGIAVTSFTSGLYTYTFVGALSVSGASRVSRVDYINRGPTAFNAGDVITTGTGNFTVVSDSVAGGSPAPTGYLIVNTVSGSILSGQSLVGTGTATSASPVYGYTTLTLTLPTNVTDCGLTVGGSIFLKSASVDFLTGAKVIDAKTPTTISYYDTASSTVPMAPIVGLVSNDYAGSVSVGAPVSTGDIFGWKNSQGVSGFMGFDGAVQCTIGGSSTDWTAEHFKSNNSVGGVLTWVNYDGAEFYPLNAAANVASSVATSIHSLYLAGSSDVDAVAVGTAGAGTATGVIQKASYESTELGGASPSWQFINSADWVLSFTPPATTADNYKIVLRTGLDPVYVSNADLVGTEWRLVPRSAKTISNLLNSTALGGLSERGGVFHTVDGKVGISSGEIGENSYVSITGGTGNSAVSSVAGSAYYPDAHSELVTEATFNDGISAGDTILVQNTLPANRTLDSTIQLSSITVSGNTATVSVAAPDKLWTYINASQPVANAGLYIEPVGNGFAWIAPLFGVSWSLSGLGFGGWVSIQPQGLITGITETLDPRNSGFFRVITKVVDPTGSYILIYNPNAVYQKTVATVAGLKRESMLPGDSFQIKSALWGTSNMGTRTVVALGATQQQIVLDTSTAPMVPYGSVAALGSESYKFIVTEKDPIVFETTLHGKASSSDPTLQKYQFSALPDYVSEALGTKIVSVNKLGFGVGQNGTSGYRYNIGLIGEANKILFGVPSDSINYPGVVSGGASYNISGAFTKRIKLSLSVRPVTGVSLDSIVTSIKSEIAGVVNKTGVGQNIPLIDILKAAKSVNGVFSTAMILPVFNSIEDQIVVQPFEKPKIDDVENDIQITLTVNE